jgi:hypothetical protein
MDEGRVNDGQLAHRIVGKRTQKATVSELINETEFRECSVDPESSVPFLPTSADDLLQRS